MDFQQKRKVRNILHSKITLVILFVILIFLAKGAIGIFIKAKSSVDNLREVKKEYQSLQDRKAVLSNSINKLKTPEGIEAEIRSKYNVAKSGEVDIVMIDPTSTGTDNQNVLGGGFWNRILGWFTP